MSVYPMTHEEIDFSHKGGTKEYHLKVISNVIGKSVLVIRFGKVGVFGQVLVKRYDTSAEAEKEFEKLLKEKTRSGYMPKATSPSANQEILSETELRLYLGRVMVSTFGAENFAHIDPDMNVSGIKGSTVEYDEEGRKLDTTKRVDPDLVASLERQRKQEIFDKEQAAHRAFAAAKEAEEAAVLTEMQQLPTYGMF